MSDNSLKKMIIFSSDDSRRILENIIREQSNETGISQSLIIEQILENALLPAHPDARSWVAKLYDGSTIEQVLCDVYDYFLTHGHEDDVIINFIHFHSLRLHYERKNISLDAKADAELRDAWQSIVDQLDGKERIYASKLTHMFPYEGKEPIILYFMEVIADNWSVLNKRITTIQFLKMIAQHTNVKESREVFYRNKFKCLAKSLKYD